MAILQIKGVISRCLVLDKYFAYFLNYLHFIEKAEWLSVSFKVTKSVTAGPGFHPDMSHSKALHLVTCCCPLLGVGQHCPAVLGTKF